MTPISPSASSPQGVFPYPGHLKAGFEPFTRTGSVRCQGTAKSTGLQCVLAAIQGGWVCKRYHGGGSSQAQRAAAGRIAEQKAAGLLAAYEPATPITDPLEQLASLAGEIVRWQEVIHDQIELLPSFTSTDWMQIDHARAIVEVYERALDRTGRVLVAIAKLDLEGRMTQVAEVQVAKLVRAVERVCDRRLEVADRQAFKDDLAGELRAA